MSHVNANGLNRPQRFFRMTSCAADDVILYFYARLQQIARLVHCNTSVSCLSHSGYPVSEMTYTVSSGTLNPIPYHTTLWLHWLIWPHIGNDTRPTHDLLFCAPSWSSGRSRVTYKGATQVLSFPVRLYTVWPTGNQCREGAGFLGVRGGSDLVQPNWLWWSMDGRLLRSQLRPSAQESRTPCQNFPCLFNTRPVVKVRGLGLSPLLRFEPPAIVWAPLIESIKCYFMPK